MANRNPNTTKMIETKRQQSEIKKESVLTVLKKLETLNDPINHPITKAEICRLANVQKPFIYKYKDELQKPIDEAIKRQNKHMKTIVQKQNFSDASKDRLVESLRRRINELESEIKKLKDENKILYGKLATK